MKIDFFDVSHATILRQLAREIQLTRRDKSLKRCLCVQFWVMPFHAMHHGSQDASLLRHKKERALEGLSALHSTLFWSVVLRYGASLASSPSLSALSTPPLFHLIALSD